MDDEVSELSATMMQAAAKGDVATLQRFVNRVAGALRDALVEFARACRRMASAADFDTEAYAWS